ncbi:hypothetical protein [Curtobacterium oceanosedimentum]|uniref:Uncharacterized protein n=1 Tax=Curtobacterium oceanosedimentum TaxID=465820 RepID=A0A147DRH1_9MICO|nr:hypothetical protein [Curtobacterium oceanosedimentum]KTR52026.1 hypothetical protein NS359_08015 [Curtobacterium oceanosedimentum]
MTVLPLTRITSSVVFPMVQLLPAAAALRRASGALAVTDPAKLLSLLEDPAASVTCPPPVEIRGFISPLQVKTATGQLSGLRGLGRTVVVVPSGVDVDDGELTTLDLQGTAVFRDASIPELLVPGDGGPREGSRYDTAFLRMRQEQLFGWMLASAA